MGLHRQAQGMDEDALFKALLMHAKYLALREQRALRDEAEILKFERDNPDEAR